MHLLGNIYRMPVQFKLLVGLSALGPFLAIGGVLNCGISEVMACENQYGHAESTMELIHVVALSLPILFAAGLIVARRKSAAYAWLVGYILYCFSPLALASFRGLEPQYHDQLLYPLFASIPTGIIVYIYLKISRVSRQWFQLESVGD